eukprot:6362704-Amphidinium_carterae.1
MALDTEVPITCHQLARQPPAVVFGLHVTVVCWCELRVIFEDVPWDVPGRRVLRGTAMIMRTGLQKVWLRGSTARIS